MNHYYIGSTQNVEERLLKHLSNHSGFTSKAKDWKLVFTEKYDDKKKALIRERQIKNWKSRKMIEGLIEKSKSSSF